MGANPGRERAKKQTATPESLIPFTIHPRVFSSLGADLVTNDIVAVIELIKNSYDAGATRVDIIFGSDESGPTLEILDNGTGMNRRTIEAAWSVIATPFRLEHPETAGRRVSGAKGLGRLSTARLGERLDVLTKTSDDSGWNLSVDWSILSEQQSLETCVAECNRFEGTAPFKNHGTRIRISGLKAEWDEERIAELEENVARLVSPFSKVDDFRIYLTAPSTAKSPVPAEIAAPEFLKKPPYAIRGHANSSGDVRARYEFNPVAHGNTRQKPISFRWPDVQERFEAARQLGNKPDCGPFEFEIRAWDIGSEDTQEIADHFETAKGSIRKAIRVHKGISVYRDGILVLPKSEQARDWLGLDLRRVSRLGTRLSTNQIVGYVAITADGNPKIEDTSDRERLAHNQAVAVFEWYLRAIVSALEDEREEDRRKPTAEIRLETLLQDVNAEELVEEMTSLVEEGAASNEVVLRAKAHNARLETVRNDLQRRFVYYSRLATVGTIAQMLVHEIRNRTTAIGRFLRTARKHFSDESNEAAIQLNNASGAVTALESLATTFAPLANRSFRRGRRESILEESLSRCFSMLETQIKNANVSVQRPDSGNTHVEIDPGELDSIILNLLDNALYWISKSDRKPRLEVSLRKVAAGKRVRVIVSDSGTGVSERDAGKIFLPGVTRKPGGIGMGLTVAAELISDHGGRISLVQPGTLEGATFAFDLPLKAGV